MPKLLSTADGGNMKAILVINHFLTAPKFTALYSHLVLAAKKESIELETKTNLELATESVRADFVLFWDKDTRLARRLEKEGATVFNSAGSIELADDKAKTYIELLPAVEQPKTLVAPLIYDKRDLGEFIAAAVGILGLPLVFKECFGSFGQQVYLCESTRQIAEHISERPFVLQEFVKDSFGHDIRLQVVGGEVVAAMERENKTDFRSNITNGGTMKPYSPTAFQTETAVKACRTLGLLFGGVDMLSGDLVCEVNSNAHIINLLNCTGIDAAPYIFRKIKEKL
ncbi:MAG: RimK family alpha-L-glutamate ligase [Clostridiales bacterium]|nr:RimK family alpha-L-glutamate ligase [Clostridiales bacterium]